MPKTAIANHFGKMKFRNHTWVTKKPGPQHETWRCILQYWFEIWFHIIEAPLPVNLVLCLINPIYYYYLEDYNLLL